MCAELVDGNISLDDLVIIKSEMEKNLKIGIVGAGIQGVCSALFVQKKGYEVTLFDRDEPGKFGSLLWKCRTFFTLRIQSF